MAKKTSKIKKTKHQKPTIRQQYMKEYKDFLRRWKRIEKRGYTLPEKYFNIPKNIRTKELEALRKKNTLDYIYDKATFYDIESDKWVSGKRGLEIERSRAGKKGAKTRKQKQQIDSLEPPYYDDSVLKEIEAKLSLAQPTYYNPHGKAMLTNLLYERIASEGREAIAIKLQKDGERAIRLADAILYDSEQSAKQAFVEFSSLISGRSFTQDEAIWLYDTYANEGWD